MMDDVHDQLTVTGIDTARTKPMDFFDAVVTVCQEPMVGYVPNEVEHYYFFNMADGESDTYGGDSSYELFERATEAVVGELQDGNRVLLHSHKGQSRSVAVATAALAAYEGRTYADARQQVVNRRGGADPGQHVENHAQKYVSQRQQNGQ